MGSLISSRTISVLFLCLLLVDESLSRKPPLYQRRRNSRSQKTHIFPSNDSLEDYKTHYYNQTLDHFNSNPESYTTFKQKYVINTKHWGGPKNNSPIFVFLGGEDPLDDGRFYGLITDNAPYFQALMVAIEHRYYGESMPFEMKNGVDLNATTLGYLSVEQALSDYAEVIWYLKKKLHAQHCPVFVIGGSYSGELAAWFRLKYPHIAMGVWASSAPLLYANDINHYDEYDTIVTKDFREASESCYNTIKNSWSIIDKIGSNPQGLKSLSKQFNTCSEIESSGDLKYLLSSMYRQAAQYGGVQSLVNVICNAIDGMPPGTDSLSRISAGHNAFERSDCKNMTQDYEPRLDIFNWQECTEMAPPTAMSKNDTMFQIEEEDQQQQQDDDDRNYVDGCKSRFGVPGRMHWAVIEVVGQDIKLVLKRFGSNILFTNSLKDPYSAGGVLKSINNNILALNTANGSHCLDMGYMSTDDPDWLNSHKKSIIKIIKKWIDQYHEDLLALSDTNAKSGSNPSKEIKFMNIVSLVFYISCLILIH